MYEVLEDIGLSRNESKVYVALSELGSTSATKIARKSKLDRANVYDSLERLKEKGLVSYISINGVKMYQSTNPECLKLLLAEKERKLNSIIPNLNLNNDLADKKEISVHEGLKAFTNILENFLNYKEEILVFGIPKKAPEKMRFFIPHFHRRRIPMKIAMKHIYNHNAKERINYLNTLNYTNARFLNKNTESNVSTNICGEEVVLVLWEKNPITIQIKNLHIAQMYKIYFEILWKSSFK